MKLNQAILIVKMFILCCLCHYINGQSFSGMLVYEFNTLKVNEYVLEKSELLFGPDFTYNLRGTEQLMIKNDMLVNKSLNEKGVLKYREFQNKEKAIVLFPSGDTIKYQNIPMDNMENLKLIEKGNDLKDILGFSCRKYIYIDDAGNGDTRIEDWIAETIPFDKKEQTNKLFHKFFFAEGIVLEKRLIYKDATEHHWQVREIEMYNVGEIEIYAFFEKQ